MNDTNMGVNCPGCGVAIITGNAGGYRTYCARCVEREVYMSELKTYGDFFTGFGGMTIGAKAAGLDVLFGVEWEEALANVYRQNLGNHIIVADVTKLDMSTLPYVDIFHASPPCTNASVANANGGESPFDMSMSRPVVLCETGGTSGLNKNITRRIAGRRCNRFTQLGGVNWRKPRPTVTQLWTPNKSSSKLATS